MIDPLSIQRTFLLFEASFCLFVALFTALLVINDKKNYKNQIIMIGNFFAAILLFSDFLTYVYDGVSGRTAFVMIRVANFFLFLTTRAEEISHGLLDCGFLRDSTDCLAVYGPSLLF